MTISEPVRTGIGTPSATSHGTTAEPRNSDNPLIPLPSAAGWPTTPTIRVADQIGKCEPKTNPVHNSARHLTPCNHSHTANRGIPMDRSHHHHQPPTDQPPETPESRTKSENTSQRPIQSTKASAVNHPCNHGHTANRSTSTIRRHHKDQPPGHRPRNHPNPRTKLEIARLHRNQSTPASGHTRPLKLFTPIKSASASAVISPLLPTLRHPSASVEGFGIHDTGFPRSDNT